MEPRFYAYPCRLTADPDGRFVAAFRDVPEALTDGADIAEALAEAAECLSAALAGYLKEGRAIPAASPARRSEYQVAPSETVAYKAALAAAAAELGLRKADVARLLGVSFKQVDRLFDADYPSKIPALRAALAALGCTAAPIVYAADQRDRLKIVPA